MNDTNLNFVFNLCDDSTKEKKTLRRALEMSDLENNYKKYDDELNIIFDMCEDVLNYEGSSMKERANATALRSIVIDEAYKLRNKTIEEILGLMWWKNKIFPYAFTQYIEVQITQPLFLHTESIESLWVFQYIPRDGIITMVTQKCRRQCI